eukprot:scaffold7825_cov162-Amphora_coffeaeformis.AAC.6
MKHPPMISSCGAGEGCLESLSHLWWSGGEDLHTFLISVRQLDECEFTLVDTALVHSPLVVSFYRSSNKIPCPFLAISLIAHDDKKDYLEAYRLAPTLVATESNPIDFLKVESMNPWNAATRLTLYWKYRREAFLDRWLLPLNLSGEGAPSQDDIALIKQDVIMLQKLPGNATLVYVDWARGGPNQHELSHSRASFFWSTFVQGGEIYLIQSLITPKLLARRRKKGRSYEIIREALPFRMLLEFFLGDSPEMISDTKKKEALEKFKAYGVPEVYVPSFLGGKWDIPEKDDVATTTASSISSVKLPVGQRKRGRPPKVVSAECAEEMKAQCDGDENEFIKKRNALYSRRLYHKKKKEKGELRETIQGLTDANKKLRQENTWLEGLIAEAELHVSASDGNLFTKAYF